MARASRAALERCPMKSGSRIFLIAIAALAIQVNAAYAWHVAGFVRCDANLNGVTDSGDLPLAGITVQVTGVSMVFSASGTTDSGGAFEIDLPNVPASFVVTISGAPGPVISPALPFSFTTTPTAPALDGLAILVDGAGCAQLACWLTGGGAKFSPIAGILVAEKGPQHSFGGNVNPGCNPESGDGGNWTHVAHGEKKHFQGRSIQVDRCGNVPGIPPGSESPVTPFNFIEFSGSGIMNGIGGNKTEYGPVTFRARAEDRNEPGSSGAKDGALIDRYFLEVRDAGGNVVLRIAGDPVADVPVQITDGNLQIHISSCSVPQQ